MGWTFYESGNTEAAQKEWQTWADTTTSRAEGKQMSEALKLWKRAGSEAFFRFRAASQIKQSEFIAGSYAPAGDGDAAFHWLQKAIDEPDSYVLYLSIDPNFDKLRSTLSATPRAAETRPLTPQRSTWHICVPGRLAICGGADCCCKPGHMRPRAD